MRVIMVMTCDVETWNGKNEWMHGFKGVTIRTHSFLYSNKSNSLHLLPICSKNDYNFSSFNIFSYSIGFNQRIVLSKLSHG